MTDEPKKEKRKSKVPDEPTRIILFESLARDYIGYNRFLPRGRQLIQSQQDVDGHRADMLRVALLRKFIVKSENTYLPAVFDAVLACAGSGAVDLHERMEQNRALFLDNTERDHGYHQTGGFQIDTVDLFEDVLYGRLLHADYDRWTRLEIVGRHSESIAIDHLYGAYEHLVHDTRDAIVESWESGLIQPPPPARVRRRSDIYF